MPDNITILHEDESLMVLNKPSGVVVNRSNTYDGPTIQDFVEKKGYLKALTPDESKAEFLARSGVVHRLDKDTSGVLVVAKTVAAFNLLQEQFKSRTVAKEYRVVVIGKVTTPKFEVEAPVGRNPKNRLSMAIVKEGKNAKTKFELLKNFVLQDKDYSYLAAFPVTGRTHQIRVHLAALNFPVVLDSIYSSRKQQEACSLVFSRMMLHAMSIEFTLPDTGKPLKMVADLPSDFQQHI